MSSFFAVAGAPPGPATPAGAMGVTCPGGLPGVGLNAAVMPGRLPPPPPAMARAMDADMSVISSAVWHQTFILFEDDVPHVRSG